MKVNAKTGEIWINNVIGPEDTDRPEWVSDTKVLDALDEIGDKRAIVRINSPGGFVDTGLGIYAALKNHAPGVDVVVDSLAASIASVIAMAGESIRIAKNAAVMIHEPWGVFGGNAEELRKRANELEFYSQRIIPIYTERTRQSTETVKAWMKAETYFSAEQSLELGFATMIDGTIPEQSARALKDINPNLPDTLNVDQEFQRKAAAQLRQHRINSQIAAIKQFQNFSN
jgi:ATP-dependent Clp protease protease subunit